MKKFFLLIILCIYVSASENSTDTGYEDYRDRVLDYYAKLLDLSTSFIYGKSNYDYIKEHNHVKLYFRNIIGKDGKINSSISIKSSIKLPKLRKNLYFSVDKEGENKVEDAQNKSSLYKDKQRSRVGLKYYFIREKDRTLYAKLGGRIKLDGGGFYLKAGWNKRSVYFGDIETDYYFNEYYYLKDKILKSEMGINFIKKLNDCFTLIQNNGIDIDEDRQTYISNTLMLAQFINKKESLNYWTTLVTEYDSAKLFTDSISFNMQYRRYLKKWIYLDIIPSIVKQYRGTKDTNRYLQINFGFLFD